MLKDILETAVSAARAGSVSLKSHFRRPDLVSDSKAANDWVSDADRESETEIVRTILGRFPDHSVLGEEGGVQGSVGSDGEFQWIVDPLDGTTNFLEGLPVFCVSIACRRGDETVVGVVLDPLRDDLFTAAKGQGATWNGKAMAVSERDGLESAFMATGFPFKARGVLDSYLLTLRKVFDKAGAVRRCGSAALDLAYTAAGIFDGFWEFRLSPWDVAAGALLIEEAGGRVTDLDGGRRYLSGGNIVAGTPGVHQELLEAVQEEVSESTLDRLVAQTERRPPLVEKSR